MDVNKLLDRVLYQGGCISLGEEDVVVFRDCEDAFLHCYIKEDIADCDMKQIVKEAFEKTGKDIKVYDNVFICMMGKTKFYNARKLCHEIREYLRDDMNVLIELMTDMDALEVELVILAV